MAGSTHSKVKSHQDTAVALGSTAALPFRTRQPGKRPSEEASKNKDTPLLLGLPFEIREQIYSYILNYQSSKKRRRGEKRKAITTKRSLLSVCHQISDEYGPLYYRRHPLHIMVHARYLKAKILWRPRRCSPIDFENLYLRTLAEYRLRNIRQLTYNATILETPCLPDICTSPTRIDWSGLSHLTGILRKYDGILESLAELKVYVEPNEYLEEYNYFRYDGESVWCIATQYGPWDEFEDELVNDGGPLNGWEISRNVRVKDQRGTGDRGRILVSFGSEFRKVSATPSVDEDEDKQWTPPKVTLKLEYY
ncbi:hypothetical protein EDD37DRAFT_644352 [Exophiala viscosa]|uniref:F-box domain-containing protein n=1 Tax=Exophiala viscosa TaxID=2486360 RepID=A0AAN6DS73_9EURO|nr:hypothetical protein EDD36DRAFT_467719 [Exophiala viscosa]KAI1628559.1 hypothetical protein EDD37DRAFT_644352 [Exophiala viscosa]